MKTTLAAALAPLAGIVSPSFLSAVAFVLEHETEFVAGHYGDWTEASVRTERDPKDPGGATRYGVDQRAHPATKVATLTLAKAVGIYHAGEWSDVRGDDLPADLALAVFDSATNCGTERAARWLQSAVGAKPDGKIGPATLAAVRQAGAETALAGLLAAREHYYRQEVRASLRAEYLPGWLNRLADLRAATAPAKRVSPLRPA